MEPLGSKGDVKRDQEPASSCHTELNVLRCDELAVSVRALEVEGYLFCETRPRTTKGEAKIHDTLLTLSRP